MYYHFCDHIYICQFKDEFILLDTKRDKYTICFQQFSGLFESILQAETVALENKEILTEFSLQNMNVVHKLVYDHIIEEKNTFYPYFVDRKARSDGVSNVDWNLPIINKKAKINAQVWKAFVKLLKVNYFIKFKGLYDTIQLIKKYQKKHCNYIIPQDYELIDLANILNKACLIYPSRIKCLEWATTFVLLALKNKWKCNLEIGVQNYPFFAHAWVECDGNVVMDAQDLREGLAIILNEPFRKLKI
jgi:hypothetical protein